LKDWIVKLVLTARLLPHVRWDAETRYGQTHQRQ
jgi:hypothetical protein